jgi:DNA helicase IV
VASTPELRKEQKYFDNAAEHRERMRETLLRASQAAAHPRLAGRIHREAVHRASQLHGPNEAAAFGRLDTEEGERWYVGHNAIHDENQEPLVVSWKAPVAAAYYEATAQNPRGVVRRRQFSTEQNAVLDFEDLVFAQLAEQVAALEAPPDEPLLTDALLAELERARTGELREIAETIQAAQYDIIREDLDQLLLVQGGPGTGKTVVALHRVSWLLYNHPDRLRPDDVLVLGPNPTFIKYISKVLPFLGDDQVQQRTVRALLPGIRADRTEEIGVARLKGELRLMHLIDQGLQDRVGVPDGPLDAELGPQVVRLDRAEVQREVERSRALAYAEGRQRVRDHLRRLISRAFAGTPTSDDIDRVLDRIWPQFTAAAFLRDLFGSEARLLRAAGADFSAEEVRWLYRRATVRLAEERWSLTDVPLLDYADFRINGPRKDRFSHIVVDEAQDLSPMELQMIRRLSSTGSMTVLGDIAQSTGPWARDSWDDVVQGLRRDDVPVQQVHLRYGYRVPSQVFRYAAQLLPFAAPGLEEPRVIRDGPSEPELLRADPEEIGADVVAVAQKYIARGLNVAVICPAAAWGSVREAFDRSDVEWHDVRTDGLAGPITLLPPTESKGLEFDSVIVIDPTAIVAEDPQGLRLLFVALTRTTRYLAVVHTGQDLPIGASVSNAPAAMEPIAYATPPATSPAGGRLESAIVKALADELRGNVQAEKWPEVLERLAEELGLGAEPEPE